MTYIESLVVCWIIGVVLGLLSRRQFYSQPVFLVDATQGASYKHDIASKETSR